MKPPTHYSQVSGWTYLRATKHFYLAFNAGKVITLALHDGKTLIKSWQAPNVDGKLNTVGKARGEAYQLMNKLEHLYPCHFLAKEWPRQNARIKA